MNGIVYDLHAKPFELLVAKTRKKLLSHAHGKILEVGAGTGFNFEHYPKNVEVIATEPHDSMRKRALARAMHRSNIRIEAAEAEALPYSDASFDTVVATLTFCSMDAPEKALSEAHRVLKPGGKMLMMEHIRKDSRIAGPLLDALTPGWKRLSGGCHLNRSPEQWISKSGFKTIKRRSVWRGFGEFWILEK